MKILLNLTINLTIVSVFFYAAVQACRFEVLSDVLIGVLAGIGMFATCTIVAMIMEFKTISVPKHLERN